MSEVTRILAAIEGGDPQAAELLPLVYGELRKLAAARMAGEAPGQTLQPTALVHEAYVRLVGGEPGPRWDGRGHFFAAEAMRRILVESARRKKRVRHGGGRQRVGQADPPAPEPADDLLALDGALTRLAAEDPAAAKVVELRHHVKTRRQLGRQEGHYRRQGRGRRGDVQAGRGHPADTGEGKLRHPRLGPRQSRPRLPDRRQRPVCPPEYQRQGGHQQRRVDRPIRLQLRDLPERHDGQRLRQ